MEVKDIFLAPVYVVIVYMIALYFRPKVTTPLDRRYFLPALTVKFIGAICLGLVYTFYYHGGDTISYHDQAKIIYETLWRSPAAGIKVLFFPGYLDSTTYEAARQLRWYSASPEYFVVQITTLISMITFNTYTCEGLFFALLSFSGMWAMYKTLMKLYPVLHRELAIACFFIPSVFFWGSGVLKDSLCIGAIGWLFFGFYEGLIERARPIRSGLIIFLAGWVLVSTKPYILYSFLPPALFWIFIENGARIKNKGLRLILAPLFLLGGAGASIFGLAKISQSDSKYSLENVAERSKITSDYIYRISVKQEGAAYKLGDTDGTVGGMIKLAPEAINVSLFRPYLWEVSNPIMLLAALEALGFLYLTISLVIRTGIFRTFRMIAGTPLLTFCFAFAMVFAIGVGTSTNNFGTLVRYRIDLQPFYLTALYIASYLAQLSRMRRAASFAVA